MTNDQIIFLGAFLWVLGLGIIGYENFLVAVGFLLCTIGAAFYTSGEDHEDGP